jgi:ABC-2 type transport system permease protein/lipopolysaccharide transport system permease protein
VGPVPTAATDAWIENTAERSSAFHPLRTLWTSRELIGFFALRDLRVRYKQAVLGLLWALAQPVATVLVFTLVFQRLAQTDTGTVPYPLFALAGLASWTYFAAVVGQGSLVLVDNASLITKVHFPRLAAPASALLPPLVDLAVALALLLVVGIAYGADPTWHLLLAPFWVLLLMLTALGPCLWLSALAVRFRDVKHALTPVLQLLLFASPVAYSAQAMDEPARLLYALNPVSGVVDVGRFVLIGADWPGITMAVSVVVAIVVFVSGSWYFQHAERDFADVV